MENNKILIWIASFVISLFLGFGSVKLITNFQNSSDYEIAEAEYVSGSNSQKKKNSDSSSNISSDRSTVQSQPTALEINDFDADTIVVLPVGDSQLASNTNATFEDSNLKKRVEEYRKAKNETSEASKVNRMTVGTFQALLLDQGDHSLLGGKNAKVAKVIAIHVVGMRSGEKHPDDVLAVRDKIAHGKWASASVVSVGYDAQDRINSVTIRPVYPDPATNDEIM